MRPVNALPLAAALLCFACDADKLTAPSTPTAVPIAISTPTSTLAPTPIPTPTPIPFQPVLTVSPDPTDGTESLQVTFDMCASTGITLKYEVESDFTRGVGLKGQVPCHVTFTYKTESRRPGMIVKLISTEMDYNYRMTVTDVGQTPPVSAIKEGTVHVFPRAIVVG